MSNALDFSGKRVLVTGGGKGIGRAIVTKFLDLNAHVIVLEKDEFLIQNLRRDFQSVTVVQVDLGGWDAIKSAIEPLLPIHHVVNNAGIGLTKPLLDVSEDDVDKTFSVNFKATLRVSQIVAAAMVKEGLVGGTIVNMSSIADTSTGPGSGIYNASKASITNLTKTLAIELAPHGIRVTAIRPGLVNTEMIRELPGSSPGGGGGSFGQKDGPHKCTH